jgi:hypothetical protein
MVIRAIKERKYSINYRKVGQLDSVILHYQGDVVFLKYQDIALFMFEPNFEFLYLYCKDKTYKVYADASLVLTLMRALRANGFIPVKSYTMVNIKDCLRIERNSIHNYSLFLNYFGVLPGIDLNLIKRYVYYDIKPLDATKY